MCQNNLNKCDERIDGHDLYLIDQIDFGSYIYAHTSNSAYRCIHTCK